MPFPEDLLAQVLIYLPVKSLMRFKCVEKRWCTLIKHPDFVTRHLTSGNRKAAESLLLKHYLPEINGAGNVVFSFRNPHFPDQLISPNVRIPIFNDIAGLEFIHLLGPCNGLVSLVIYDFILICNPALREFELLSPSPFAFEVEGYYDEISGSGFGFDANSNCYKLVQVHTIGTYSDYDEEDSYKMVDLYDSSTNTWKLIDDVDNLLMVQDIWGSSTIGFDLFFNGACHWKAHLPYDNMYGSPNMGIILSFNVSTEVFQILEFPDGDIDEENKYPSLIVLNECLGFIRYGRIWDEPQVIDIWVMKEYGIKESWNKLEVIVGPYLIKRCFCCCNNEWLVAENNNNHFACCGLYVNEVKTFQGFDDSMRAIPFRESIISLSQVIINVKQDHTDQLLPRLFRHFN